LGKRERIFIGLLEVAGYAHKLGLGFEGLGHKVSVCCLDDAFSYSLKGHNWAIALYRRLKRRIQQPRHSRLRSTSLRAGMAFCKVWLFLRAISTNEVFIFLSSVSFFHYHDLPILRLFGKKIIFVFLGSDSRPWYLNGSVVTKARGIPLQEVMKRVVAQKRAIKIIERYSDIMVDHPPAGQLHERPFISFLRMGFPMRLPLDLKPITDDSSGSIRIVHAPSFPEAKGSDYFAYCIEALKREGYHIEYVVVKGLSNEKVLAELAKCDLVLDELYSDSPLAGLASEAAFLGKPAIVGSYTKREQLGIPNELIPPSAFVHPEKIDAEIRRLCDSKETRERLGEKAREFVTTQWAPEQVAERFLVALRGPIPRGWLVEPQGIVWFSGWGISQEGLKSLLASYIAEFGESGMYLGDKPELLSAIRSFAFGLNAKTVPYPGNDTVGLRK